MNVETKAELDADENSFNSILVLEGEPVISGGETVSAKKGESVSFQQAQASILLKANAHSCLQR